MSDDWELLAAAVRQERNYWVGMAATLLLTGLLFGFALGTVLQ